MSFIEVKNVKFRYPQTKKDALGGIELSIEKGEYVSVIGHNGSGKSTLARLMNGLLLPTEGEVLVDGFSTADKQKLFEIRKRVGVVFQNPDNQLVASIVEDDVAFGPENIGVPRKEIGERIDFALKAVGMEEYRKSTPSRLSGGQKQRVAIAGVLAIRPEMLILDESTAMLDPRGRKEVTEVVERLNRENGMTVLTITHYMDEVCRADRVIVLSDGQIVMQGTPEEIFSREEELRRYELDVPVPVFIADKLRAGGMDVKKVYFKEQLGEELCRSLPKN
ncbi:MAG: energy-coupling factor transporter ATPase [Eubacteriales bacterium]